VTAPAAKLKRAAPVPPRAPATWIHKVTKKWTTADGQKVRICDMSDDHLLNAVAACQRIHEQAVRAMPFPSFITGEEASFLAEWGYDNFLQSGPEESFQLYEDLCLDAERRGLELPENGRRKL